MVSSISLIGPSLVSERLPRAPPREARPPLRTNQAQRALASLRFPPAVAAGSLPAPAADPSVSWTSELVRNVLTEEAMDLEKVLQKPNWNRYWDEDKVLKSAFGRNVVGYTRRRVRARANNQSINQSIINQSIISQSIKQ